MAKQSGKLITSAKAPEQKSEPARDMGTININKTGNEDEAPCVLISDIGNTNNKCRILVDTGASSPVLKASKCPPNFYVNIKATTTVITGVTAHELKTIGVCDVPIILGCHYVWLTIHIVDDDSLDLPNIDAIISRNCMRRHGIYIRGKNDKLLFKSQYFPLEPFQIQTAENTGTITSVGIKTENKPRKEDESIDPTGNYEKVKEQESDTKTKSSQVAEKKKSDSNTKLKPAIQSKNESNDNGKPIVKICNETIIPPESISCIPVQINQAITGNFIYMPNEEDKIKWELNFCPSLHNFEDSKKLTICAFNAGKSPVSLQKNVNVGQLIHLDDEGMSTIFESDYAEIPNNPSEKRNHVFAYDTRTQEIIDDGDEVGEEENKNNLPTQARFDLSDVPNEIKKSLIELLIKYDDVFYKPGDKLSTTDRIEADIETGTHPPISRKPYKIAHKLVEPLRNEINELLNQDIIEEANLSPWNSPIILITKPTENGIKSRLVVDFTAINAITAPLHTRFPETFQTVTKVAGHQFYSKLDMVKAYHQIGLKESAREKTTFACEIGNFRYKKLPMGLKNSGIYFMRLMDSLIMGRLSQHCTAFVDDLLVHSKDMHDHLEKLEEVFQILRNAKLTLKAEKCKFFKKQVAYLGFDIDSTGFRPSKTKIEKIANYPRPTSTKQVQMVIGLFGYFRRHCSNFAKTATPLTDLLRKGATFTWTMAHEEAFQQLKKELCERTLLTYPDFNKQFYLYVDASNKALGACLAQKGTDNIEEPLAFESRRLNRDQEAYAVTKKELTGLVWAVKQFIYYLTNKAFIIFTDHKPIEYLMHSEGKKPQIFERYRAFLSQFTFEVRYIEGSKNNASDALSRIIYEFGKVIYLDDKCKDKYQTYEEFLKIYKQRERNRQKEKITQEMIPQQKTINAYVEKRNENKCKEEVTRGKTDIQNMKDENNDDDSEMEKEYKRLKEIKKQLGEYKMQTHDLKTKELSKKEIELFEGKLINLVLQARQKGTENNPTVDTERKMILEEIENEMEELDLKVATHVRAPQKDIVSGMSEANGYNQEQTLPPCNQSRNEKIVHDSSESDEESDSESSLSGSLYLECCNSDEEEISEEMEQIGIIASKPKAQELWEIEKGIEREKIKAEQMKDVNLNKIIIQLRMEKSADHAKDGKKYCLDKDDVLFYIDEFGNNRIVIPESLEIETISKFHSSLYLAHAGIEKMYKFLRERIYMPCLKDKITSTINRCQICKIAKPNLKPLAAPMQLHETPSEVFQYVNFDCLGPLHTANNHKGYLYALVMADRLSHWVDVFPMKDLTGDTLVYTFMTKILPQYGLFDRVICDSGPNFRSEKFKKLCLECKMELVHSTAYYPQGNGLSEKTVRETKQFIRNIIADRPGIPWYDTLAYVKIALRTLANTATGYSPYQLVYGRKMKIPIEQGLEYKRYNEENSADNYHRALWNIVLDNAKKNLEHYQNRMKAYKDKKLKPATLKLGQEVYLKQHVVKDKQNKIYTPKFFGPFIVIGTKGANVLIQEKDNPSNTKKMHISKLKPMPMEDDKGESKWQEKDNQVEKKEDDSSVKLNKNNGNSTKKRQREKEPKTTKNHDYNLRKRNRT